MNEPRPIWYRKNLRYLLMLDGAVLVALAALVLYTVSRHEPWADEAQAWLIARDFGWWRMILGELRYEGHPPLWFAILWPAIHFFHMPYTYLGYLGGSIAILGLAVLIFFAPFPRVLRYLIASSFFFVYQYAVIARPYVLMPLLAFGAAYFYRKGVSRILAFGVCTALLIQVSSYAAVIAIALSTVCVMQFSSAWKDISDKDRKRVAAAGALIALSLVMVVAVLLPRSDSSLVAQARGITLGRHLQLVLEGLIGSLSNSWLVAIPGLFIAGVWAYQRGHLLLMVLSVGGTAMVYGFLRGYGHHQGLITIAFVAFLWAAWPDRGQADLVPRDARRLHQAAIVALLFVFGWHCEWSYIAIRSEWAGAYSGARDAAMFLQSVHADQVGCRGYTFWSIGVQPYFDHNIFANQGGSDAAASHHFGFEAENHTQMIFPSELQEGPPIVVSYFEGTEDETAPMVEAFTAWNFRLIHLSDGRRFFKGTSGVRERYLIFARTDWILAQRDRGVQLPELVPSETALSMNPFGTR